MAKALHRLTAKQVENAAPGASLNDGGGLFLRCAAGGAKRWVFRFKLTGQAQREMGLGAFPGTSLAIARQKAAAARERAALGFDPIAEAQRAAEEARAAAEAEANAETFGAYADKFVEWKIKAADFTNPKHIYQWRRTFTETAAPLRHKKLADITREDILAVLGPIWDATHTTAARVRGRLEAMFDHAIQNGAYRRDNPARWNLFNASLSKPRRLTEGHQPAMPWQAVPEFIKALRQREGFGALALEYTILTAARSGEVRLATWREIDLERQTWTIPAARMKTRRDTKRRDHVVPLTPRMVAILEQARAQRLKAPDVGDLIFPGAKPGQPLSDMTLRTVMRRMDQGQYVPHGFRSAFRDWAGSRPDVPRELAEEALAHVLGDVEGAYRREQSVERRRAVMAAWEAHLNGDAPAGGQDNVVPLRA